MLTHESIAEAVDFRQMMARIRKEKNERGEWWFTAWQPEKVLDKPFEDVDPQLLISDPTCWILNPDSEWHRFKGLTEGYCLLDPIKVNLITPGITVTGKMADPDDEGNRAFIPAPIVTAFLDSRGIIVEKTGDYTMLFLFSMGITKGKWGSLIDALLQFKQLYDSNSLLEEALPTNSWRCL